jgi:hypothetical protein
MRWIFTYNEPIKKHIEKVLKTKIKIDNEPWLHIAVKTISQRNPWCGFVIYVWDTREVVLEYRSKTDKFNTEMFTGQAGFRRAIDNRKPLIGKIKPDTNHFFELEGNAGNESLVFSPGNENYEYSLQVIDPEGTVKRFKGIGWDAEIDDDDDIIVTIPKGEGARFVNWLRRYYKTGSTPRDLHNDMNDWKEWFPEAMEEWIKSKKQETNK